MYTPKHYKIDDKKEIFDFIDAYSFGILISANNGKLTATHIPFLLKRDEEESGFLYGHIAKANQQWKDLSEDVLVIFPGPHKYISSSWYETDQSVPTWNYLSVHVYGKIKILEDRDDREKIVREAVKYFEDDNSNYKVDNLKSDYFEAMLRGIVAFKIEITNIEGKQKLSQNHSEDRQQRVINKLEKLDDEDSKEIVRRMKNNLKQKTENE